MSKKLLREGGSCCLPTCLGSFAIWTCLLLKEAALFDNGV